MIDLKNFKMEDFRIVEAPQKPLKDKVFIPFFRVKKGEEVIERKVYEHSPLPPAIYALFHKKV